MTTQNFTALLLNLDRDIKRLDHMRGQLEQAGVAFIRLPGIWGDALPDDLRGCFFDAAGQPKTTMKRGEIGCYASHLRALRGIAAGDYGEAVLVMEDDLNIAADLIDIIAAARIAAPVGWDIIRLSNPPRRAYAPVAALPGGRMLVRYSKIPTSAGAYLVTPRGARKFLDHGMRGLTFDDDLRRPWFHDMDSYGIVPPPICAGVTGSSSIDAAEAGRFDKGVSAPVERLLRGDHLFMFKRALYNIRSLGLRDWLICAAINLVDMSVRFCGGSSIIHRTARLFRAGRA